MSWTRLTLQVRTPLFGGDDPRQHGGCPIRVPSIRGALRFWFRAVAAGHQVSDLTELWEAEQSVFGSTSTPSAIGLRVVHQPTVRRPRDTPHHWATTEARGFDGAQYLLGQGLWKGDMQRDYVAPGEKFPLDIRFSRNDERANARFMLALWAWLTYGGLGARTRRGFGQLVCTRVLGELPCGWTQADLRPPDDVDGWHALGGCALPESLLSRAAHGWGELLLLPAEEEPVGPMPELPALAPRWWAGFVLDEEAGSLGEVLHLAGLRWRRFRVADGSDYLEDDKKPGPSARSPEWTQVIHKTDEWYPIAALGLPVGYFSRSHGSPFKAEVAPYLDDKQLRRASPVWLRPVPFGDDRWGVFSHVFFAQLLPPDATLRVTGGVRRTLPQPPVEDVEEAWNRWIRGEPRLPDGYSPRS